MVDAYSYLSIHLIRVKHGKKKKKKWLVLKNEKYYFYQKISFYRYSTRLRFLNIFHVVYYHMILMTINFDGFIRRKGLHIKSFPIG